MDNLSLFLYIFALNNHSLVIDNLMIFGADYIIYVTVILMFFLAVKDGVPEKKALVLSLISLPIVFLVIKTIHIFLFTQRPFVEQAILPLITLSPDASFPSRHTSIMAAIAFPYIYFGSKWALFFVFLMFWVGFSRVYVGVHYPVDIIGGIVTGGISLLISLQFRKFFRRTLF